MFSGKIERKNYSKMGLGQHCSNQKKFSYKKSPNEIGNIITARNYANFEL